MRISDWSSDVCASDLESAQSGTVGRAEGHGASCFLSFWCKFAALLARLRRFVTFTNRCRRLPLGEGGRRQRRSRVGHAGVELSTIWLQGLVQGTGHELMLFAAVGILLIGLDDLLLDALWLAMRGRRDAESAPSVEVPPLAGRFAIFVPAWDEAKVLPATLHRTLAAWDGEDFRLYVGCYPNDADPLLAVSPVVARDPRLRLVVGERDGPTTKGDNLNRLWAALGEDERAEGQRFAAVLLHDAEDHVHPGELALFRLELARHAMVAIPVVPLLCGGSQRCRGHYGCEFAQAHGKELVVRSRRARRADDQGGQSQPSVGGAGRGRARRGAAVRGRPAPRGRGSGPSR